MESLFEDEYMKIDSNGIKDCLEVVGKKMCETPSDFKRSMEIINQYVKHTNATKIIFSLDGFNTVGNEQYISKEFIPVLALLGVKHIVVITGENQQTKWFFSELSNYTNLVKKEYDIESIRVESMREGLDWIKNK